MSIIDYFDALERIVQGRPRRIPQNSPITNDNVSLEAGRGKGAIKKCRPEFESLINAIQEAKSKSSAPSSNNKYKEKISYLTQELKQLRTLYQQSVAREILLHDRLVELEKSLLNISSNKIVSIRSIKNKT